MDTPNKKIKARFYLTANGGDVVRDWIIAMSDDDRRLVGKAIQLVEFGWPIGMPYSRKLDNDLWEVRANLTDGKIARVIFTLCGDEMVLLHGFVKKTQQTPHSELEIAKERLKNVKKV